MRHIEAPPTYIPPSLEEMRSAARSAGIPAFAPDFLADLTALAAGGELRPLSAVEAEIQTKAAAEIVWSGERWTTPQGARFRSLQEAIDAATEEELRYAASTRDFLREAPLPKEGSPLQRAVRLLKLLAEASGGNVGDEGGVPIPAFSSRMGGKETASRIREAVESVEALSKEEKELLDPNQAPGQESGDPKELERRLEEHLLSNEVAATLVKVARNLDELSRFRVRRERKFRPDVEGTDVRTRPIKGWGELGRLAPTEWALRQKSKTLFWMRAATRQAAVRERGFFAEKKQLIFLVVDGSDSMSDPRRIGAAAAVALNRLQAVQREDCRLWLAIFDKVLHKEVEVTKEGAAEEMRRFTSGRFITGRGTSIDSALREAARRIAEGEVGGADLDRPEIVVVTDGDDSVSVRLEDLSGCKLHAFCLDVENKALSELAESSGGVGVVVR